MILSDREIQKAIKLGRIEIDPAPKSSQYTSSALDLTLSGNFFKWKPESKMQSGPPGLHQTTFIDPSKIKSPAELFHGGLEEIEPDGNGCYLIKPKEFVLSETRERIVLPLDIAARVEGRSTLARCGLIIHMTAPVIHAGFRGVIVLEICNFGEHPIKLVPGLSYCQVVFEVVRGKTSGPPKTSYLDQKYAGKKKS